MGTITIKSGPKHGDERGRRALPEREGGLAVTQDIVERFCAACGRWGTPTGLLAMVFGICPTCGLLYFPVAIEVEYNGNDLITITACGHEAWAENDPGDGWGGAGLFSGCSCGQPCDYADAAEAALEARNDDARREMSW
ncbi:MAG: hypothetical protein WCE44_07135 [Candidatus Velthaea sp.]